jgi:hypothetical protein
MPRPTEIMASPLKVRFFPCVWVNSAARATNIVAMSTQQLKEGIKAPVLMMNHFIENVKLAIDYLIGILWLTWL